MLLKNAAVSTKSEPVNLTECRATTAVISRVALWRNESVMAYEIRSPRWTNEPIFCLVFLVPFSVHAVQAAS